jgi:GAF domain-containing protein/HAMP domain-containing protein
MALLDRFGPQGRIVSSATFQQLFPVITVTTLVLLTLVFSVQFRSYRLRTRLIIAFFIVAIIASSALAGLNYFSIERVLTESVNRSLYAAAQQTVVRIDSYLQSLVEALKTEAATTTLRYFLELENRAELDVEITQQVLLTYQRRASALSYALLDLDGKVLLDTATADLSGLPTFFGLAEADPAGFSAAGFREDRSYVSPILFAKTTTEEPYFFVAVGIKNAQGQPVGVLMTQLPARFLQEQIVLSNNLAGPESFAILFDDNHLCMANGLDANALYKALPDLDRAAAERLQAVNRLPNLPVISVTLSAQTLEAALQRVDEQPYFQTADLDAQRKEHVAAALRLGSRPWLIVYLQSQSIAMGPVQQQTNLVILFAVLVAGGASLGAAFVAQLVTRPIITLTRVAENLASGDYAARAPVESQDEIGALAKTFNSMADQLRQTLQAMEQRVAERTQELEQASEQMRNRATQLQRVAEVAHVIASIQDLDTLLRQITQLISQRFGYYHVGIFLLDKNKEYAVLQAANSQGGQRMLARGHRLRAGQVGIVGFVVAAGAPRIALDVGQDAIFFDNPDLPDTRSEIALPLKVGDRITGALDVQSTKAAAFTEEDIALLSTMADQVAIAIENARLFGETRQTLEELQTTQHQYLRQEWTRLVTERKQGGYVYDYGKILPIPKSDQPALGEIVTDGQKLSVPLNLRGQVIGLFDLEETEQGRQWSEEEINLVNAVADQVALALENARLIEETTRRAEREHLVADITAKLRASNDPQAILQTAASELRRALQAKDARIVLQPLQSQSPGDRAQPSSADAPQAQNGSPARGDV